MVYWVLGCAANLETERDPQRREDDEKIVIHNVKWNGWNEIDSHDFWKIKFRNPKNSKNDNCISTPWNHIHMLPYKLYSALLLL